MARVRYGARTEAEIAAARAAELQAPRHLVHRGGGRLGERPGRGGGGPAAAAQARRTARSCGPTSARSTCPATPSAPARSPSPPSTTGVEGWYPLVMPMTHERALIGGREVFGEPKKLGEVTVERDGLVVRAALARHGIAFVEVRGAVDGPLPLPEPAAEDRLLLQVPARRGRFGLRRRPRARPLHPQREGPQAGADHRRRGPARVDVRPRRRPPRTPRRRDHHRREDHRPEGQGRRAGERRRPCCRTSTSATTTRSRSWTGRPRGASDAARAEGQVAVVTGAASGIGLAMARRFAAEGLKVVLADVEEGALRQGRRRTARGRRPGARPRRRRQRPRRRVSRWPTPRTRPSAPCMCCATTRASARAPRAGCGSTSPTTGSGPSRSTCGASSTASRPSSPA